jgi:hypothetical protein
MSIHARVQMACIHSQYYLPCTYACIVHVHLNCYSQKLCFYCCNAENVISYCKMRLPEVTLHSPGLQSSAEAIVQRLLVAVH